MSGSGSSGLYKKKSTYKTYYTDGATYTVYAHKHNTTGAIKLTTSSSPPSGYTYTGASLYPTGYGIGDTKIYDYELVSSSTVTLTGTSGEITLEPAGENDTETATIDISITGATVAFN